MAKGELSIEEKLTHLHALQKIDSKIDEIHILKGELPIEVSDLEDEIAGLQTRNKRLSDTIDGIEKEIAAHNGNIKESEALIAKYEKQLDTVKNNREFDALTKELELQKLEIQLSEKKIREATTTLDMKKEAFAASNERLEAKNSNLESKKVELDKIIEKTNKEEIKLTKQSVKARKGIEERILKAYDKIRKNYKNGLSVVKVERNSCGGCFNRIPAQMQIEIGLRMKIIACEHCGRILVDDEIGQKVKVPAK
jgi:predicted  nucleic acid-binding Zn-ribbon protein